MSISVIWHQNDLRVEDNPALVNAAARSDGRVVPVMCIDTAELERLNPHTRRFRLETLASLEAQYERAGTKLLVVDGDPAESVARIARDLEADGLYYHHRYTAPHRSVVSDVVSEVEKLDIQTQGFWGDCLFDPTTLPAELKDPTWQFGEFQDLMAKQGVPPGPVACPTLAAVEKPLPSGLVLSELVAGVDDDPRSLVSGLRGGSEHGMQRLLTFFSEGDHARDYSRKRDQLLAPNATSRLSMYLAQGAVSPRQVFHELKQYEKLRVYNRSTRELTQEIYQREFFHLVALAKGEAIYALGGINQADLSWDDDPEIFQRWSVGQTGWPFIDAHMRELAATGYMTYRGRQNVACFFARDLEQDWRIGARYFEQQLVDHEPCSNMGNWQRSAGVSPSPLNHRFSIRRQSMRYDREARYIRQWVPELKHLPPPTIHEMNGRDCSMETGAFGVQLGETYPRPISRKTWKKRA